MMVDVMIYDLWVASFNGLYNMLNPGAIENLPLRSFKFKLAEPKQGNCGSIISSMQTSYHTKSCDDLTSLFV